MARNSTEARVAELERIADIVIDTQLSRPEDVVVRAASHLDLYYGDSSRTVDIVVGGQFGSEGKGHIASYLAREYRVLVRVGGPNAGHKFSSTPVLTRITNFRRVPYELQQGNNVDASLLEC